MRLKLLSILVLVVGLGVTGVLAQQGATVNPLPGSVWTYLGPTIGADWVAIPAAGSSPQIANYIYAGPTSGANNVPTFRPMVSNDILPSPVLRGDPQAPTPAVGDNDTSIATTAFVRSQINTSTTCPSITNYGGVGDDTTDNTAAFNAAKLVTKCISFPAGTFRFNSAISYAFTANLTGVTIKGEGTDITVLHFPNAVGTALAITKTQMSQSVHLRDFTMTTGTRHADTGVWVNQTYVKTGGSIQSGYSANDMTNLTFRSDEGYWEEGGGTGATILHGWTRGVRITNDSVWDLTGITVYGPTIPGGGYAAQNGENGSGIIIEGTWGNPMVPVIFNITRANLMWVENGITLGANTQGYQIANSNIVGCFTGIWAPPGVLGIVQVAVANSQLNNVYGIVTQTPINTLISTGNTFYVPIGGRGIFFGGASSVSNVTGNAFTGTSDTVEAGSTGLLFGQAAGTTDNVPAVVTGNTFYKLDNAIGFANAYFTGPNIAANMYRFNTVNIVNNAGNAETSITGASSNAGGVHALVTGAIANPNGVVRLTVVSTNQMYTGMKVLAGGVGGVGGIGPNQGLITTINVVDATHIDLLTATFSGAYTSGGAVTSLP